MMAQLSFLDFVHLMSFLLVVVAVVAMHVHACSDGGNRGSKSYTFLSSYSSVLQSLVVIAQLCLILLKRCSFQECSCGNLKPDF